MSTRWDLSQAQRHVCDLATARVSGTGITLDFGAKATRQQGAELAAELLRSVEIDAAAAHALRKLLASVLAR